MGGETDNRPSGWTTDTLKEFVNQRFADNDKALQAALVSQEKAVAAALAAAKEAVNKAEKAAGKQFDAANGIKSTFGGELNKKLDRTEYDANHKALEKQLDGLARLVYIGLGAVLALQFVLQLLK